MTKRFDPNSDEQLIFALKLAYRHTGGDESAGTTETMDALADALCNLIGDDEFSHFTVSWLNSRWEGE